jgi:hypothetical protein
MLFLKSDMKSGNRAVCPDVALVHPGRGLMMSVVDGYWRMDQWGGCLAVAATKEASVRLQWAAMVLVC